MPITRTKSETKSLMWTLKTFEFVMTICFQYGVLKKIDCVKNFLQKEDATIEGYKKDVSKLFIIDKRLVSESIDEAKFYQIILTSRENIKCKEKGEKENTRGNM